MGLWLVSTHSRIWESIPMTPTWYAFVLSHQFITDVNKCKDAVNDELSRVSATDVLIDVKSRHSGAGPGTQSSICLYGSACA